MGYVLARIRELKAELAAMPEVDPAVREVNKQAAIAELAPVIGSLQKKGYSLDQVVELLAARANIPITVGTLKTYLSRLKGRRRPRGPAGDAPSTPRRRARTPAPAPAETPVSTAGQQPDNTAVGTGGALSLSPADAAAAATADAATARAERADSQAPTSVPSPTQPRDDSEADAVLPAGRTATPALPKRSVGREESPAGAAKAGHGNPGAESSTTKQEPQATEPQAPPRSSKQASFAAREDTEEI